MKFVSVSEREKKKEEKMRQRVCGRELVRMSGIDFKIDILIISKVSQRFNESESAKVRVRVREKEIN